MLTISTNATERNKDEDDMDPPMVASGQTQNTKKTTHFPGNYFISHSLKMSSQQLKSILDQRKCFIILL